jgi:hypothetical protein
MTSSGVVDTYRGVSTVMQFTRGAHMSMQHVHADYNACAPVAVPGCSRGGERVLRVIHLHTQPKQLPLT